MPVRELVNHHHPVLRKKAEPVDTFDDTLKDLVRDMYLTMYHAPGIGLAAPQLGISRRIIVMDIAAKDETPQPITLINPEILALSDNTTRQEEGCLSLPGQYADVTRPERCFVRAKNVEGESFEADSDGLLARCIQHEIDHLEGVLFIDHVSRLKRNIILRRLNKQVKAAS